jgi:hypothetical protein
MLAATAATIKYIYAAYWYGCRTLSIGKDSIHRSIPAARAILFFLYSGQIDLVGLSLTSERFKAGFLVNFATIRERKVN